MITYELSASELNEEEGWDVAWDQSHRLWKQYTNKKYESGLPQGVEGHPTGGPGWV